MHPRIFGFLAITALLLAGPAHAAEHPSLARARALYNGGDFQGAINSASLSREQPASADASTLVIARSLLERYRVTDDPSDLAAARDALASIRSAALSPRDQVDLLIGFGQSLHLAKTFGAAAEIFDVALGGAAVLGDRDRLRLLDWWATSVDREAQTRAMEDRVQLFERIATRMEKELRLDPGNAPANYWLAVSTRGGGDAERAWDVAIAGWVRAQLNPETTHTLRTDLDRLVVDRIIPARARRRPASEQEESLAALRQEWMLVKQQWQPAVGNQAGAVQGSGPEP